MTEPIDTFTQRARAHLFSMMARGKSADAICDDMALLHWPKDAVLNEVFSVLKGTLSSDELSPTERAVLILWGTAAKDRKAIGGYRLNGRPASVLDIIKAANVVLNNFGFDPLRYPGVEGGVT